MLFRLPRMGYWEEEVEEGVAQQRQAAPRLVAWIRSLAAIANLAA